MEHLKPQQESQVIFHLFSKLPPEIRNLIWLQACLRRPRTLWVTPPKNTGRVAVPAVAHTNHESRATFLSIYIKIFRDRPRNFYMDVSQDTLRISRYRGVNIFEPTFDYQWSLFTPELIDRMRHIKYSIGFMQGLEGNLTVDLFLAKFRAFTNLQSIQIVYHDQFRPAPPASEIRKAEARTDKPVIIYFNPDR